MSDGNRLVNGNGENTSRTRARRSWFRQKAVKPQLFGVHLITWAVVLLITILPLIVASPTARSFGKLPANTQIAGVDVSRLRPEDALARLDQKVQQATATLFRITILDQDLTFTATDIGLVFDPGTTVAEVLAAGEGGDYELHTQLNPEQFQIHLDSLHRHIPNPARNAEVRITGTTATVVPGANGESMNIDAYRTDLLATSHAQSPHIEITLTNGEPDITTVEAETTVAEANAILQQPLLLTTANQSWEISSTQLANAIIVAPDGQGGLTVQWNLDALQPEIDRIVGEIEAADRTDAWVQDLGTHSWLVPEQGSVVVDRKQLIETMNATLTSGAYSVAVPVTITPAEKTTDDLMADLGITQLIASGDSVYEGSGTGRVHNVETAAFYIDRTLVAPGGSYSFNDSVGSLFSGEYMSAGSYIDGPGGQSIAGGVCQVSTTVFRAALNAGFPIEERWPHSYRTVFYEMGGWGPGFDAAIVQDSGVPEDSTDLRFANPTDSWLLLTATTDGNRLVVDIWGEETGYEVQYSEPEVWVAYEAPEDVTVLVDDQLPTGTLSRQEEMDGLSVVIVRGVYDRDGSIVLSDTWETTYYATGPVVRVSPDMENQAYLDGD